MVPFDINEPLAACLLTGVTSHTRQQEEMNKTDHSDPSVLKLSTPRPDASKRVCTAVSSVQLVIGADLLMLCTGIHPGQTDWARERGRRRPEGRLSDDMTCDALAGWVRTAGTTRERYRRARDATPHLAFPRQLTTYTCRLLCNSRRAT